MRSIEQSRAISILTVCGIQSTFVASAPHWRIRPSNTGEEKDGRIEQSNGWIIRHLKDYEIIRDITLHTISYKHVAEVPVSLTLNS